jgi:hypothetical protein
MDFSHGLPKMCDDVATSLATGEDDVNKLVGQLGGVPAQSDPWFTSPRQFLDTPEKDRPEIRTW